MSKQQISLVVGVSLALFALCAVAQTDSETIEARLNEGFQALTQQDFETLASLCTNDWVHLNHMGMRWSMDDMKQFFTDHITEHTIEVSNIDTHVSGDASMAWATFDETTSYKFDSNPVSESAIFTAVFVKEDDAWKMRALQRTLVQPPPEVSEK